MSLALKSLVFFTSLLLSYQAIGQDNYTGEFRGKIPIGAHTQLDEKGEPEISVTYSRGGVITHIKIAETNKEYSFPPKLDSIRWSLVKPGLWINRIEKKEDFEPSFPKKAIVKCHFAGYLLDGQSFDNSFVRTVPFEAPLNRLIPGFSLGLWNVPIGEVRVIKISPKLAYKDRILASVPPTSTLIYFIYRME